MKNFFTLLLTGFFLLGLTVSLYGSGSGSALHVEAYGSNEIYRNVENVDAKNIEQESIVKPKETIESVYQFEMKSITGEVIPLETYKGRVVLIVNTASKCGYTPQYEGLQTLYDEYGDEGFVILGFPANNFMNQEPGTNEDILTFCTENYGVTFPMFSKVSVKGDDQDPLFTFLTNQENEDFTGDIRWNFEKFLIDKEGNLVRRFRSGTKPDSKKFLAVVNDYLKK